MTVKHCGNDDSIAEIHANGGRRFVRDFIDSVAAVTLIASLAAACQEPQTSSNAESNGGFDAPIRKETVDLGASPYFPDGEDAHPTALSCFYFPDFMVKEHDLGGRGAEWLSMLPNSEETPQCRSSHEPGERVIEYPEWEGYFMGVKGNLAFFLGSDTVNGGLPFAVYDASSGERVFEDSAYDVRASFSNHVEVLSTSAGYLLRYLRVVDAGCDLNSEGDACWDAIRAAYALRSDTMPRCTGYERIADLIGADPVEPDPVGPDPVGTVRVESVIAYPVEVTLSPVPSVRSVPGTIRCWPSH